MKKIAPTRSRARYHHGDLRNALQRAALGLVARRGVEGFSLREAARAVGVSPAAAYRHFQDKSALVAALALEGFSRMAGAMEEALARAPGAPGSPERAAAELAAIGGAYVEFAVANPSTFRVMFGPWCEHPGIGDTTVNLVPNGRDPYQILVDTLDALVRTGAISPAAREGAEIAAWASVHGLSSLLVEGSLRFTPAERRAAIALVARAGLAALGAASPTGSSPGAVGPATRSSRRRTTRRAS